MGTVLEEASERAIRDLETLDQRTVAPPASGVTRLETLPRALPQHPTDPQEGLSERNDASPPGALGAAGTGGPHTHRSTP